MNRFFATFVLVMLTVANVFAGEHTLTVDGVASGRYYNDVWKSWSNENIVVYVDNAGNTYIFGGEGSLLKARGIVPKAKLSEVVALLKKSQQWAAKAQAERVELTKSLGTFFTKIDPMHETGVSLTFFSSNQGVQTDVIMEIKDFENMFSHITLYLNTVQVQALISLLDKVPDTLKELSKQEDTAKGFQ